MSLSSTPANAVVAVGQVRFGNALPLSLIAGPCALESREHALETASALKEIAARLGIGLGAAKVRSSRARLRLRALISGGSDGR